MQSKRDSSDLRANLTFDVDHGISITTAPTTTLPARLSPQDALKIPKGASWTLNITWYDQASLPVDLVVDGYTAAFTARIDDGATPLISVTDADGITLGAEAPNIIIQRTAAQTAAYDFVRAWCQLTVTRMSDGHAFRLFEGFIDLVGMS